MPSYVAEQSRKQKVERLAELIWEKVCQPRLCEIRETGVLTPTNSLRHRATRELLSWASQLDGRWPSHLCIPDTDVEGENPEEWGDEDEHAFGDGVAAPVPKDAISKCGSCHWFDGEEWHVGDEPPVEMWFVPVGESAGADGGDEAADEDPADGNEGPDHTEPWETGASHDHEDWAGEEEWAPDEEPWVPNGDEDVNQAEHLGESWAADDEQQLTAQDEPWPADDPSHQAEPWKASDDDGPDEEQWKAADDEGSYEEQWEAADDEGLDHDEEQWEEQWKAADDEGPDEEQWKAADDEGPNHEEQWKAADEQGPNPEGEQWTAADDEDPNHDGTSMADEEWEAAVGAETDIYPTWPRAPITNVTQEYPTKADRERLDEPSTAGNKKVSNPTEPVNHAEPMPTSLEDGRLKISWSNMEHKTSQMYH
ncbi:unnamed protein product [Symbiodinium sp. CCMP2592]|nr:unnamed protein product [Symbiodinium sp. CCMP2592]